MSNEFPATPDDLALAAVTYTALLPSPGLQPQSPISFGGVTAQLAYGTVNMGAEFSFNVPGNPGSFDQTTFEGLLAQSVTAVLEVLAGMSGVPLATLQGETQIRRNWTWTTAEGHQLVWQDLMTYP